MSLLLKNALVVDSKSPFHNKKCDLLIENGVIQSMNGDTAQHQLDLQGKMVSPGWFDLSAHFNDPGFEYKEDILSGSRTATAGGFTDVLLIPSTNPPIDSKSGVEYINRKSIGLPDLHVNASLSENLAGENLTEMLDLHAAGAKSFSEGDRTIANSELLLKALQYTASLNIPVFQNPRDPDLSKNTHMHEGSVSTHLGLRGEPGLSEELIIQRDLEILKYSGGRLHFSKVSSAKSVDLLRKAKDDGLNVSADVGINHLIFTDQAVGDFETNFKVIPPYRTEMDRKALVEGISLGIIDAISSNHRPQDQESKELAFDLAGPGIISLQTFYSNLLLLEKDVPLDILIDRITYGPRRILGIDAVSVAEGSPAKMTIYDPAAKWTLNQESNKSKSKNTPSWSDELTGKVLGVLNGDQHTLTGI